MREREGLAILSAERVRQELLRLLAAPRGPELVARHAGLRACSPMCLPVAPRPPLLAPLGGHRRRRSALTPDAVLRLAALAVEIPEDADRLRDRLRLSNEEHADLALAAMRRPSHRPGRAGSRRPGLPLR